MTRNFFGVLLAVSLLAGVAKAQTFGAVLTGSQERPTPTTTAGWGNATFTIDPSHTSMTVTITVANLNSPVTSAHIHEKTTGSETGSVVESFIGALSFANGTLTGTVPMDPAVAARIIAKPSNFYVDVHTQEFPNGAIRGEIAPLSGTQFTFAGEMHGPNEVPQNFSTAVGSYFITVDKGAQTITYEINANDVIEPTLAHIHAGAAGTAGSPVVTFATGASSWTNGRTAGVVQVGDAALLASIVANPENFYVNVHSTNFPGGEIRAQLTPANEVDAAVAGRVTNALGQTFVTDVRIFNPSYDDTIAPLVEFFPSGGSNITASSSIVAKIPPRGTVVMNDAVGPVWLNVSGIGALRISSEAPMAVTSRIFNDQRLLGKGTIGQFVPSTARSAALRRGVLPQLSNSAELTVGSRTNIGFFNPNPEAVTVRLELRNPSGTLIASNVITLSSLSQQQTGIGGYFPNVDLSKAVDMTMSFDANAPIVGYASVVDNLSSDQIYVAAQPDAGVAANNR
jgi:hypothetical protein